MEDTSQFDIELERARRSRMPMPAPPTIPQSDVNALYSYLYGAPSPMQMQGPPAKPTYPTAQGGMSFGPSGPAPVTPGDPRRAPKPMGAPGPMPQGMPSAPLSAGGMAGLGATPPMPGKDQSRLPAAPGAPGAFVPGRGAMWTPPRPSGATGGGGAAPGGAASPPTGQMTWQQVVKSVADANPDLAKSSNGRAVIAMAALQLIPLMDRRSQMEMQHIARLMQMQMQMSRLDLAQERLKTYQEKASGKDVAAQNREYQHAVVNYQRAANELAMNRGDKNLQEAFTRAKTRLDALDAARNPPTAQSGAANFVKGKTPQQVISALPRDMMSKLTPAEQTQFAQMLIDMPEKAQEAIDALDAKLSKRSTTEVQKSYGSSR